MQRFLIREDVVQESPRGSAGVLLLPARVKDDRKRCRTIVLSVRVSHGVEQRGLRVRLREESVTKGIRRGDAALRIPGEHLTEEVVDGIDGLRSAVGGEDGLEGGVWDRSFQGGNVGRLAVEPQEVGGDVAVVLCGYRNGTT